MSDDFFEGAMLIGGELCAAKPWLESVNPATERPLGRVPAAAAADVDRAVTAAAAAQGDWALRSVWERGAALRKLAAALRDRADEIVRLEAADTGNTIAKLGGDIAIAAGYLDYFAGLGSELKGTSVPATARGYHFTRREPYGVVARIVPFNHPFMFAAAHLAAPLMAGNSVVVKTPETSPLSGTLLAQLCQSSLPPGLVNIISGYGVPAGDALVRHPLVRRIGFTGSLATGLAIQRAAAESAVKHVSLELGGKNPLLVFPDADVDTVSAAAVAGMNFSWAGQSCGSTSRLLVHASRYDAVVEAVTARVAALRVGDPLDPTSDMGPVNSAAHYAKVQDFVAAGIRQGARLTTGGQRPTGAEFTRGYWIRPAVFTDVTMDMRIAREEIFGPVLAIQRWDTLKEAITLANATDYGLTAALWTNDLEAALAAAAQIEAGYVWINGVAQHYVGTPFGGWKDSGLGAEECLDELLSYSRSKALHILLPE
jgi:acyl-CoA reductase-like NAD-dependent aldehyde dehydrogenase